MGGKPILTVLKAEGHSADTGAGKFPLVSMGGRAEGLACADGERGPPSALAEIFLFLFSFFLFSSTAITVLPERVVVGFPNFAWAPKKK